jgi:hypothetical protein
MNSTIKTAAKLAEELNQSNENSDTKRRKAFNTQKTRRVFKEEM